MNKNFRKAESEDGTTSTSIELPKKSTLVNSDYANFEPLYGNIEDYEIIQQIGKGKYCDAFKALRKSTKQTYALKVLKPNTITKFKREVYILKWLRGGPNIVKIVEVFLNAETNIRSIAMELLSTTTLKALDYAHSHGVMHRDIKPLNVVVDENTRSLRVIDWGLAEFYDQSTKYSTRVGSRCYKAPELLLNYPNYDYSLDVWAFGCVLATLIFRIDPFFRGRDDHDQLVQICNVLGTKKLQEYMNKYDLYATDEDGMLANRKRKKAWRLFENAFNKQNTSAEVYDLLNRILVYDHSKRLTVKQIMDHDFYAGYRYGDVCSSASGEIYPRSFEN